ncbi:MAG: hypothetical protein KJZ84_16510 [Bryobacteraceae bacterium]|nr:hypothetical protein [Bryobacteraceae bacterium]
MARAFSNLILLGLLVQSVAAQDPAVRGTRRAAGSPCIEGRGSMVMMTVGFAPLSLRDLVGQAQVILTGTVASIEAYVHGRAAQPVHPRDCGTVGTEAIVRVDTVLKADSPFTEIRVYQTGGRTPEWATIPQQFEHLKENDRVVLFLTPWDNPELPDRGGLPRFVITGVWTGAFRVEPGGGLGHYEKTRGSTGSNPVLKAYSGRQVEEFLAEVRDLIAQNPPPVIP